MNGWIIHKKSLGENHEVSRLVEEFEKQGVDIRVVNPKDVDIFVDRDDRKSILVEGIPRKLPDFVLPRTGSGTTYFIKAIIRHLERLGVVMINGSDPHRKTMGIQREATENARRTKYACLRPTEKQAK